MNNGRNTTLTNHHIKLVKAFENRDIEEFRNALKINADSLILDEQNLCIFDRALQTPGCAEFVAECLKFGCDRNYVNQFYRKAAINFATDSRDPKIVKTLLSEPGIQVDHIYSALTPLNSLAKILNNENFEQTFKCIKILLEYGASPNIADQREMTPLHNLVKNPHITDARKYELVEMFLKIPNIDIDTYREGELRRILETEYPSIKLPAKTVSIKITYNTLLSFIRSDNVAAFVENYNDETRFTTKEEDVELLVATIEKGAHQAFDLLMAKGVDYNRVISHDNTPIQIAWIYGNWYALDKLLKQADIRIRPKDQPLSHVVCKLGITYKQSCYDYWKCFYILLDSEKININAMDHSKSTALHYAVKHHNNRAVSELLKRGACICVENVFHDLPLNGLSPFILEEHLNDCISSNEKKFGDKDYEIIINFKNFILSKKSSEKQLNEVLTPIQFMVKSKEYRHLLQHPVITSILYLKWQKLALLFYIKFLIYLFFAISVASFCVLKFRANEYEQTIDVLRYCSWLGICYLMAREFLQFLISPFLYMLSLTNYLELLLILSSIVITCDVFTIDLEMQRNIAVACILLSAYELVLLVGYLPASSISTHMLMLKAVCKSFVKGFVLYSIFIITFTMCFYIKSENLAANQLQENRETAFHKFSNPLTAFAKTIVMLTGEFDASSMQLDSMCSSLLFLSFVFFMTIILFNLINGLAVSDTQAIKNQAELNEIICRFNLLSRYERIVFKQTGCSLALVKREPFRTICYVFKKLFPTYTTDIQISILPNDKNRILKLKSNKTVRNKVKAKDIENDNANEAKISFITETDDDQDENKIATKNRLLEFYFSFITNICSKIDKRTVTQAMAVLERKSLPTIESRLEGMDEKLNKIMQQLKINGSTPSPCC